jgi:hypothetical protein
MIAYHSTGTILAIREGAELLVHQGPVSGNDSLWRKQLDAEIVGLGADDVHVVAVTDAGTVRWFAAHTGADVRTARLPGRPERVAIDVGRQRVVAVTAAQVIALDADGAPRVLAEHGASAIAMAADGGVLLAHGGELVAISADGVRAAAPYAGDPICALAWHPGGFWLLGTAARVLRWTGSGEPGPVTKLPAGKALDFLACSARAIALAWNHDAVYVLAWPSLDTIASLTYPERKVQGIAFGPWPWLGVALDQGDGNWLNLERDLLARTDTHAGRTHHSWLVMHNGPGRDAKRSAPAAPPRPPSAPASRWPAARLAWTAFVVLVSALLLYLMVR